MITHFKSSLFAYLGHDRDAQPEVSVPARRDPNLGQDDGWGG